MVTRPSLLLIVALLLAAVPGAARAACDVDTISRKLRLAEQARFWSNFWEELDERERRVELLRARFLYGTVRALIEDPGCAGEERLETAASMVRRGLSWTERTIRVLCFGEVAGGAPQLMNASTCARVGIGATAP